MKGEVLDTCRGMRRPRVDRMVRDSQVKRHVTVDRHVSSPTTTASGCWSRGLHWFRRRKPFTHSRTEYHGPPAAYQSRRLGVKPWAGSGLGVSPVFLLKQNWRFPRRTPSRSPGTHSQLPSGPGPSGLLPRHVPRQKRSGRRSWAPWIAQQDGWEAARHSITPTTALTGVLLGQAHEQKWNDS